MALAQDDVIFKIQVWLGFISPIKINQNWSITNDSHFVPESFLIIRTGINRKFLQTKNMSLTATVGYSHLWLYPQLQISPTINERRPWSQLILKHQIKKTEFTHRFRHDARFRQIVVNENLTDDFWYNNRIRYAFMFRKNIFEKTGMSNKYFLFAFNEYLYDFGKNVINNHRLNQNRVAVGLGYQKKSFTAQLGYINMLKLHPTKSQITDANTAMLWITKSFSLK